MDHGSRSQNVAQPLRRDGEITMFGKKKTAAAIVD
ncbi:hypothetical protein AXFE_17890 [Acidithrix ferrooxidans]|uniref:Uncharacterized protein n=1 Tax=Acidithrix ferrooxidans TaxID=1280514 RepID=A0A0D8HHA1_9ACTN|nr:hypothetical protein AXFE_17890 [Acidithrix ferrooxidans]